ncbi:MAG: hypothetical protein J6031_06615 [Bacteroidales bacterium]|nr:hypothetical protein [Bacteroidales bacterium]
MSQTSIYGQIQSLENLIAKIKQVPLDADKIEYQLNSSLRLLRDQGLPTDLEEKFREKYMSHISSNMQDLCERLERNDIPFLEEQLEKLWRISKR